MLGVSFVFLHWVFPFVLCIWIGIMVRRRGLGQRLSFFLLYLSLNVIHGICYSLAARTTSPPLLESASYGRIVPHLNGQLSRLNHGLGQVWGF